MQRRQNTDILHDRAIQPGFIEFFSEADSLLQFALLRKDIERQIHFSAEDVCLPDGSDYIFLGEVLRVCSCAEFLAAQIDGVRACLYGAQKGFPASRGRKELRQFRAAGA